jgi:uncharacterized repeat protein (TIGR02543 family)
MRKLMNGRAPSWIGGAGVLLVVLFTCAMSLPAAAAQTLHIVTFFENANPPDLSTQVEFDNVPETLTSFVNLSPAFEDAGYTFTGWNTSANGSGNSFPDGSMYSFSDDISLYAQWTLTPVLHTITFDENDNGADSVSTFQVASEPTPLNSFSILQPKFEDAGYMFTGWNTSANGGGMSYADGSTYAFNSDLELYAQWGNGATGLSVLTLESSSGLSSSLSGSTGGTVILPTLSSVDNQGYSFLGWNTASDGDGDGYAGGASMILNGDQTLFAQWIPDVYIITYLPDGGTSPVLDTNYNFGSVAFALPTATQSGYTFEGWFSSATNGTLIGLAGVMYLPKGSVELYAQWSTASLDTLTFNANGGSGSITAASGVAGTMIVLPGQQGLIRVGFTLERWNTKPNGTGTALSIGQSLPMTGSSILYAQWTGHEPVTLFGAVGSFKKNSAALSLPLENQIQRIADTVKAKRYLTVTLYGYTASTGLASLDMSLSRARALHVANYLRSRLTALQVKHVSIRSAGEGAIAGESSSAYSRVEVFGV